MTVVTVPAPMIAAIIIRAGMVNRAGTVNRPGSGHRSYANRSYNRMRPMDRSADPDRIILHYAMDFMTVMVL